MTMVIAGTGTDTLLFYRDIKKTIRHDSSDFQFASAQNHGDVRNFARQEDSTGNPIFLQENKTNPFSHIFRLVNNLGAPLSSNYAIENANGGPRVFYRPSTGLAGMAANQIWHSDNRTNIHYHFSRRFTLDDTHFPPSATALTTATTTLDASKSSMELYVNGAFIDAIFEGAGSKTVDIFPYLKRGENEVLIRAINNPDSAMGTSNGPGIGVSFAGLPNAATLGTSSPNDWSASLWSSTGVTGLIEYKPRQGAALYKKQDTVGQSAAVLKTLANIIGLYTSQESTMISILR